MNSEETIFDLFKEQPVDEKGFMDLAASAPEPKDNSFLETAKDYGKTALKGIVEGVSRLGSIMGPLRSEQPREQQLQEQTDVLNELLPTEDTFGQRALRRGLKEIPTAIASPIGGALQGTVRGALAGTGGETAKELGAPEWAQTLTELGAYLGPDVTKKLLEKGKYKEIIESGRKFGMTDRQITPLIQSDFKQKWLSKVASKKGSAEKSISKTKGALDSFRDSLNNSPDASKVLNPEATNELILGLSDTTKEFPTKVKDLIKDDIADLLKGPIDGKSLFNLWNDVNYYWSKGEKQVGLLKGPLKKAISSISPEIGQDFEKVNKLYTKFYPIAKAMKPGLVDSFIKAGESFGLLGAIAFFNYPAILSFGGKIAASKITEKMLTNPRFQQLSHKMINAIQSNAYPIAEKTAKELSSLIKSVDPKAELPQISEEDFEKFFNQSKQSKMSKQKQEKI